MPRNAAPVSILARDAAPLGGQGFSGLGVAAIDATARQAREPDGLHHDHALTTSRHSTGRRVFYNDTVQCRILQR